MRALIDGAPLIAFALGVTACAVIVLRGAPRLIAAGCIAVICFIPWWTGVGIGSSNILLFLPAASLICIVALVCLVPSLPDRIGMADWTTLGFFVACLLPIAVGGASRAATFGLVVQWLPALLVGRLIPVKVDLRWIYGCIAVLFSVVSVFALAEFLLSWNPFVLLPGSPGSSYSTWATLQQRGGIVRAEGAFGHSIALGSSVAMAIPIALASRFKPGVKAVFIGLMLACAVVTFSRIAMVCAVLGIALSVLFLREGISARMRVLVTAACAIPSLVFIPLVSSVFVSAGSEATNSAAYRGRLISLVPDMTIVGASPAVHRSPEGEVYIGNFRSIDSALILMGLTYGWLALLILALVLAAAIVLVVARHATAPTISIVAGIPAFATVALITQYQVFVWLVVGLALFAQSRRHYEPDTDLRSAGNWQSFRSEHAEHSMIVGP